MKARLILIAVLLLNAACGFQLRGSQPSQVVAADVYLNVAGAPKLTEEVRLQLSSAGMTVHNSVAAADYIITLTNRGFARSVLRVDATTGKAREYQISISIALDITHKDGRSIINNDVTRLSRDFIFDGDDIILSAASEEELIKSELLRSAANQLLWRIQLLISKDQKKQ